jgi:hypothetical protein
MYTFKKYNIYLTLNYNFVCRADWKRENMSMKQKKFPLEEPLRFIAIFP